MLHLQPAVFVLPALARSHSNLRLNHVSDLDNCPLYLFVEARRVARRQDLEKPESRSASCSAGRSRRNRRAQVLSRVPGADGRANNLGPDYQALQAHRGADERPQADGRAHYSGPQDPHGRAHYGRAHYGGAHYGGAHYRAQAHWSPDLGARPDGGADY